MKKNIRRILGLSLALALVLVGCKDKDLGRVEDVEDKLEDQVEEVLGEEVSLNIGSLKGATTIGLGQLIRDYSDQDQVLDLDGRKLSLDYDFHMAGLPEEIVAGLNKGELDMAAIPANLAASLYNKTEGEIQVLATNTLGVLYMVENSQEIETIEDLNGKTIYSIGKGITPEAVLNSFIGGNQLDVNVEFKSEAPELAALLKTEENIIALLPEPFVSVVEKSNDQVRRIFDMNEQWEKVNDGNPMVTGVLVARKAFVEENQELVDLFLAQYEKSINESRENPEAIAATIEGLGIVPEGLASAVIPNCKLEFVAGQEMKAMMEAYLQSLYDFKPELVGGSMPSEEFYYTK